MSTDHHEVLIKWDKSIMGGKDFIILIQMIEHTFGDTEVMYKGGQGGIIVLLSKSGTGDLIDLGDRVRFTTEWCNGLTDFFNALQVISHFDSWKLIEGQS